METAVVKGEPDNSSLFCPECPQQGRGKRKAPFELTAMVDWIACDACDTYYHWECVRSEDNPNLSCVLKWYCDNCVRKSLETDNPLASEFKPQPRKSGRATKSKDLNYSNLDQHIESDPNKWAKIALQKDIRPHEFPTYPNGTEIDTKWLWSEDSMRKPMIFLDSDGLGMRLPPSTTTVQDVANLVGPSTPIEVIDVASQTGLSNWTLGRWAQYYSSPDRKVRNVISLEVSHTALGDLVEAPRIVREMDWIDTIWPTELKLTGDAPRVSKYCLMSVEKCWTDWHIDFAASSVWYHILRGSKTFYFIKPTTDNLREYERWSGSHERQENTWLGDKVDAVYEVNLTQGNTMIIPTGWIHAVYTPTDSLVFGGNFLNSLNIPTQLELHRIEVATRVPKKFRYPHFVRFLWFVAKHYFERLEPILSNQSTERPLDIIPRVLKGLKELARFLREQTRRMDKSSTATPDQRKAAKEAFPATYIPDAAMFTTNFRSLVIAALGETEADQADEEAAMLKYRSSQQVSESPSKKRKTNHRPATTQSESKNVESFRERRPLPRDDGTFGPEQEVEVQRTTTIQKSETRAKGAGKIVVKSILITNVQEKVIWLDDGDDTNMPSSPSKMKPSKRERENSVAVEIPKHPTADALIKEEPVKPAQALSIPAGLLDFISGK